MCGIAGFVGFGTIRDLEAMTASLAHRGPDGSGVWQDPDLPVFLGHRRLSVIDLEGGAQPMWDEAGAIGVVYNGEIYNHLELRRTLEAAGCRFRTSHSDTEVLIHGYRIWGDELPARLNGMFAFAIFDRRRRRMLFARDRFGEKPLYIYRRTGVLAFASELAAFTRHSGIAPSINGRAVQKFFAWGFIPAPNALYRDCQKLRGGSRLVYDIEADTLSEERYWRFALEPDETLRDEDTPQLAEELRALLQQAVSRRLMSDVPLGLFLSGGIDSSAVLAACTRERSARTTKTFTIGFNEPSFDESPHALAIARHFGVDHHQRVLDVEYARDLLPHVLRHLDEPLGDASIVPTHLLSRFARESVVVALSGDGGDELFAGYDPFRALAPAQIYARLVPRGLHRGLRRLSELVPNSTRNMGFAFRLRRLLTGASWPTPYWNPVWLAPADPETMRDIFAEPLRAEDLYEEALGVWAASSAGLVDKTLEFYTNFYLPDDILTKSDRASMMASLEVRAPFLDNDLVDFCRRLPSRFKYRRGERKWLLKRALRPWLPDATIRRRKKGFGIPTAKWLRQWHAPTWPNTVNLSGDMPRVDALGARWERHRRGSSDERLLLFAWLGMIYNAERLGGRAA